MLVSRLDEGSEHALPKLLELATLSKDPHIASSVEPLMDHKNHDIRIMAVSTLGKLQAEKSVPILAQIMKQKSVMKSKKIKSLQLAAARALAEIATDGARSILKEIAEQGSGELQAMCQE